MKIVSDVLGEIEVNDEAVIRFEDGIPGFEEEKEFIVLELEENEPFVWLISAATPYLAFMMIDPFRIFSDYEVELPQTALKKLNIEKAEDVTVYTIVVLSDEISESTTNLQGPIVINAKAGLGKQVILDDNRYTTKHYFLKK